MIRISRSVRVVDSSEVAEARRVALQCAAAMRLGETVTGRAALVATELATNLVKHGQGGSLLFGSEDLRVPSLVMISIDKGPGLPNVAAAMRDGYSTAGSPGTGLGAVNRSSSSVAIYTLPDRGTAILCRIENEPTAASPTLEAPSRMMVGGVCVPKPGEEHPGDAWTAQVGREVVTVTVADGLGHGMFASTASSAMVRVASELSERSLEELLRDSHGALRATRGAAVGVARIHLSAGRLEFIGVGNIAGTIVSDDLTRKTVSLPGIVGHEMRKLQVFSYPWLASSVLILQSDGVSSWNATNYPGLMQHEPALIAAVLYRDFCRGTDDATVVVAKVS
jgi:anti-sigma regulatory factor (Ser/Thr protein kinase)